MDRNYENRFTQIATIEGARSKFHMPKKHLTTFNTGDLIPFYSKLVYPGDNINIKTNYVVRTTTPIKATMDVAYLDTYYYFVPMRLVWEHWAEFMGENKLTAWEQPTEYQIPQITAPSGGWANKTLADHFGIRPGVDNISVTALKGRAYALIYNEWFRDQNIQDGLLVNTDDTDVTGSNGTNQIQDCQLLGMPAKVNKFHDYFTSCLPAPQKGPEITIPLGTSAPVRISSNGSMVLTDGNSDQYLTANSVSAGNYGSLQYYSVGGTAYQSNLSFGSGLKGEADLQNATAATLANLRQAFAIQHLYELDARGGTRYTEINKNHFGVITPDARAQKTEYIGGTRTPMNVIQVVQTSETTANSAQGNIAGYSLTADVSDDVEYASTEHGYIIGLACVRTNHTYQQGIAREDSYKDRLDFFWGSLEGIGEQAVLNKEIFVQGTSDDDEIFGYQERYAEAKTDFNTISGEFRDEYTQSLGAWHYGDNYESLPVLSEEWLAETPVNMDKTLQVTSEVADQIHADFYIDATYIRKMQMYAIPGLSRI